MLALTVRVGTGAYRRFAQDSSGSVAMVFSLALIPIMVAVGAAIDYSRANSVKAVLQATLDSALLAGAKDGSSSWAQVAQNVFQANFSAKSSASLTPTFSLGNNGAYTGTVSIAVPTSILAIVRIESINVSA